MTPKQALGILHRLSDAYVNAVPYEHFQTPENKAFRLQVLEAYHVLAPLVLGNPSPSWHITLCDYCHEAYAPSLITVLCSGYTTMLDYRFCCSSCLQPLLAQNAVLAIDGQPVCKQEV